MQFRVYTFTADLPRIHLTRGNDAGLLNLPLVETTSFGKNSVRYNALLSWNFVQSLLPVRLCDLADILTLKLLIFYPLPTMMILDTYCLCRLVCPVSSIL